MKFIMQQQGMAAMEFALLLPVLVVLFAGMTEIGRLTLAVQKLNTAAATVTDLIAQGGSATYTMNDPTITQEEVDNYMSLVETIMQPYPFDACIITSSISTDPATPGMSKVLWQSFSSACNNYGGTKASKIGAPNNPADLSDFGDGLLILPAGQGALATEVYFQYTPIFSFSSALLHIVDAQELYGNWIQLPRAGNKKVINLGTPSTIPLPN